MMKVVATIWVVLAFTVPTVTAQNKPASDYKADKSHESESESLLHSPPATGNQATTYEQAHPTEKPQRWHKFVAWPEGITAWLLMLTLGAIIWQAFETRRGATATRESAEATQSGARATKEAAAAAFAQVNAMNAQAAQMERQTTNLEKSLVVAQESANAANRQIRAMMNKERARIRVIPLNLDAFSTEEPNKIMMMW